MKNLKLHQHLHLHQKEEEEAYLFKHVIYIKRKKKCSWPPWPPPETPARVYKMRLLRPSSEEEALKKLKREGENTRRKHQNPKCK